LLPICQHYALSTDYPPTWFSTRVIIHSLCLHVIATQSRRWGVLRPLTLRGRVHNAAKYVVDILELVLILVPILGVLRVLRAHFNHFIRSLPYALGEHRELFFKRLGALVLLLQEPLEPLRGAPEGVLLVGFLRLVAAEDEGRLF
jgi:hypothetical protein